MSQNTFKNKLKEGSGPQSRSGKTIFSWIEEKLDVKRILGEGVPVQLVPPVGCGVIGFDLHLQQPACRK